MNVTNLGATAQALNQSPDPHVLWSYAVGDQAVSDPVPGPEGDIYLSSSKKDWDPLMGSVHSINSEGALNWKTPVRGPVSAAPVVWKDRLYIGTQWGEFYALNRDTGAVVWQAPKVEGDYRTSPAVDGQGNLYTAHYRSEYFERGVATPVVTLCRRDSEGGEVWTKEFVGGAKVERAEPVLGPLNTLLYSAEKALVALDRESGEERWRFDLGGRGGKALIHGDRILIASVSEDDVHRVRSLDPEGNELWSFTNPDPLGYHIPELALDEEDDALFVGDWGKAVFALKASTGEQKWSKEPGGYGAFIPSVGAEGEVYFAGGRTNEFHVYDADTGDRRWSFLSDGRLARSPLHVGETVYVSGQGTVVALAEDALERRIAELSRARDPIDVERGENLLIVGDFQLEINP